MIADGAITDALQYGAAGAVIVVVFLFLKFLRWLFAQWTTVVSNHINHTNRAMSENAKALSENAAATHEVAKAVDDLRTHCSKMHNEAARRGDDG